MTFEWANQIRGSGSVLDVVYRALVQAFDCQWPALERINPKQFTQCLSTEMKTWISPGLEANLRQNSRYVPRMVRTYFLQLGQNIPENFPHISLTRLTGPPMDSDDMDDETVVTNGTTRVLERHLNQVHIGQGDDSGSVGADGHLPGQDSGYLPMYASTPPATRHRPRYDEYGMPLQTPPCPPMQSHQFGATSAMTAPPALRRYALRNNLGNRSPNYASPGNDHRYPPRQQPTSLTKRIEREVGSALAEPSSKKSRTLPLMEVEAVDHSPALMQQQGQGAAVDGGAGVTLAPRDLGLTMEEAVNHSRVLMQQQGQGAVFAGGDGVAKASIIAGEAGTTAGNGGAPIPKQGININDLAVMKASCMYRDMLSGDKYALAKVVFESILGDEADTFMNHIITSVLHEKMKQGGRMLSSRVQSVEPLIIEVLRDYQAQITLGKDTGTANAKSSKLTMEEGILERKQEEEDLDRVLNQEMEDLVRSQKQKREDLTRRHKEAEQRETDQLASAECQLKLVEEKASMVKEWEATIFKARRRAALLTQAADCMSRDSDNAQYCKLMEEVTTLFNLDDEATKFVPDYIRRKRAAELKKRKALKENLTGVEFNVGTEDTDADTITCASKFGEVVASDNIDDDATAMAAAKTVKDAMMEDSKIQASKKQTAPQVANPASLAAAKPSPPKADGSEAHPTGNTDDSSLSVTSLTLAPFLSKSDMGKQKLASCKEEEEVLVD